MTTHPSSTSLLPSPLNRQTKIVATLGPASCTEAVLKQLILAGANVFRLNFSHGTQEEKRSLVTLIRELSLSLQRPIAVLADLQGPKFRLGLTADHQSIHLAKDQSINLKSGEIQQFSDKQSLVTGTKHAHTLLPVLQVGHRVLIDDGAIVLLVEERISEQEVKCKVVIGGDCSERKGVNVPDLEVPLPALTDKDVEDAIFAYHLDVEYIALSFVQRASDVTDLRTLLQNQSNTASNSHSNSNSSPNSTSSRRLPKIVAKIEKPQALLVIDEIIAVVDAIMVARGDYGVEAGLVAVPAAQKMLISKCNSVGKPVITATQMLQSMIESPIATRAEISDIYNAVLDGTDATMLSAESASGKYPVEAVTQMADTLLEAEKYSFSLHKNRLDRLDQFSVKDEEASRLDRSIAASAVAAATQGLQAKALILISVNFELAAMMSQLRPNCPIIVVTFDQSLACSINLLSSCHAIVMYEVEKSSTDQFLTALELVIHGRAWLQLNDPFVLACGDAPLVGLKHSIQLAAFGAYGLNAKHAQSQSIQSKSIAHNVNVDVKKKWKELIDLYTKSSN